MKTMLEYKQRNLMTFKENLSIDNIKEMLNNQKQKCEKELNKLKEEPKK
uniref:Uncharacterized protein n=1 Tax=Anguilla anguilla TaxID=7936 RepID=A0A0E9SSQ8_ANGAN